MREVMTTTIQTITAHMLARLRNKPASANGTGLTAEWQPGMERIPGFSQRKLRLFFGRSEIQCDASQIKFPIRRMATRHVPAQSPPEVLVTTVTPRDVPRVLERVATLDGFINANINAQVQGYIVSRDYQA